MEPSPDTHTILESQRHYPEWRVSAVPYAGTRRRCWERLVCRDKKQISRCLGLGASKDQLWQGQGNFWGERECSTSWRCWWWWLQGICFCPNSPSRTVSVAAFYRKQFALEADFWPLKSTQALANSKRLSESVGHTDVGQLASPYKRAAPGFPGSTVKSLSEVMVYHN